MKTNKNIDYPKNVEGPKNEDDPKMEKAQKSKTTYLEWKDDLHNLLIGF